MASRADRPAARRRLRPFRPPSQRLVDAACWVFAAWTLAIHGAVALGGSLLDALVAAGALAGLGVAVAVRRLARGARLAMAAPGQPLHAGACGAAGSGAERAAHREPARGFGGRRFRGAARAVLVIGGGAALVVGRGDPVAGFGIAVAVLGAAALVFAGPPGSVEPPAGGWAREALLWSLALACAALALVAHRADGDDGFYVNVAAAMADAPADPILRDDTLHGVPGLPIHHPAYRLHSFEALAGAFAFATGIPAIAVFHLGLAAVGALLVPLAQARLFRVLTPRTWPWSVVALLAVLVAAGDEHRSWGNFAFVRMWQGKAFFLWIALPLVQAYALEFALAPSRWGWLRLAAAQVAALGATSTAVWAAPVAATSALACAVAGDRKGIRILVIGASASLYVLGAGLVLRSELSAGAGPPPAAEAALAAERRAQEAHAPGVQLVQALDLVLGGGRLRTAAVAATVLGWAVLGPGLARRFAIVVPALAALLLEPHASRFVAENAVGPSTWRVLWVVPMPALLALVLTSPLRLAGGRRRFGRVACAVLVAVFALGAPARSSLARRNGVHLAWPGLKVPLPEYRWAELLTRSVPPGSHVVAPLEVSGWVPVFQQRAFPLVVQDVYLRRYRRQITDEERRLRLVASRVAGGQEAREGAESLFAYALERFDVKGALLRTSPRVAACRRILAEAGFRRRHQQGEIEVWVRP